MEMGKKIVNILLIIAAVAATIGGVFYSLFSMEIFKTDSLGSINAMFTFTTVAVIGGYAVLGLSIISIILTCLAKVKRPVAVVGISGVLCGGAAFLLSPAMSIGSALRFALSMPSLLTSGFYTNGVKFFGLGMVLFAVIALILAIVDIAKTNRGE